MHSCSNQVMGYAVKIVAAFAAVYPQTVDASGVEHLDLADAVADAIRASVAAESQQVFVDGALWQARLADPASKLGTGEKVVVVEVQGLTLIVEPQTENNQGEI